MFNLDPGKLIVIAVVAIILLGPDKLPQVARQVGSAWRSFGEFRHRMESEVRSSMPDLPPTSEIARLARSPAALLHHLSTMSEKEEETGDAAAAAAAVAGDGEVEGADDHAEAPVATPTPAATNGSPSLALPADNGALHDAGTNGSGPALSGSGAEPLRPPPEPVVQADPNLN